ncbi:hypothetical protein BGZ61DRAFT_375518 [Ilyonectria robusta]|uniref:uncharacterized protein n=1 Tax=Ilyonectria robusta TaxID=1079257 RepID=UPI001E8D1EB7|nr:uncharacterized protein BGZ61DRAFT_375518 [Ilyonectria robusta]KAH8650755.1 hypothetical protein BGZ61DRAFT_375518 [Ilyonectria robusta]
MCGASLPTYDDLESTSHETRYSGAEVYKMVRNYMRKKDGGRVKERQNRRSGPVQLSLKMLLKRHNIVGVLGQLLKFPGVIEGLQLSNIHKHLALHFDERICHYFEHIQGVGASSLGSF